MTVNSPWDEPGDAKERLRKVFLADLLWILTAFEASYGCLGSEHVLTAQELVMLRRLYHIADKPLAEMFCDEIEAMERKGALKRT